jgi:hypothetical protein
MVDADNYDVTLAAGGRVFHFLFDGGPISNPKTAHDVFIALGIGTAAWARLEQHVDAVIIQINKTQHSHEKLDLYDPEHPRPFTDKIRLLKRYFKKHPALQNHKKEIDQLLRGLPALAETRNIFAHGNLEKFDPKTEVARFRIIRTKKDDVIEIQAFTPPLSELMGFADLVSQANKLLRTISAEVFTADAIRRLRRP